VQFTADRGGYSSKAFVCTIVNGIPFYKALNLMPCNVMCLKLYCVIKKFYKIICSAVYIAWSKGYVRSEGLIAVTMSNAVSWDIRVCSLTGL